MRYEIDENNYITAVYFNCNSGSCTEYTGNIPDGYTSLEEWVSNANILAYKVVDGNLVYDSNKDAELQAQWAIEERNNKEEQVYSLEETKIGTWIDGKPIYRKVIITTDLTYDYSHLNVDSVVDVKVLSYINGQYICNTGRNEGEYNGAADKYTWFVDTPIKTIIIQVGSLWTFNKATIIFEYTKQ